MAKALSVAKELVKLSLSGEEADPLTNLRLQKLLYYAQAWSLIVRDSQLFPEHLEAWKLGPVVPNVYRYLPDGRTATIVDPAAVDQADDLNAEEAELVRCVWDAYRAYSPSQLTRMTHEEDPWIQAWGGRGPTEQGDEPITVQALETYFAEKGIPGPLASFASRLKSREEAARDSLASRRPLDRRKLAAMSKGGSRSLRQG